MGLNPGYLLTLIGMRGDTFISLSFLNQILSAVFYRNNTNFFDLKIDINWVNLTLCLAKLSLIKSDPRWR